MTVCVRFAPSPTGYLHIGNARTAMLNWAFCLRHEGIFVLRFDDTDIARSKEDYIAAIERDLEWLSIRPDMVLRQSEQDNEVRHVIEALKEGNFLYPCYETPEELADKRARRRLSGLPPIYDRSALHLSAKERRYFEDQGRKPHWRFKLSGQEVCWHDMIRGAQSVDSSHFSDPVLVREDGSPLYTLSSVVSDIYGKVTHIIRGEDHATNTAVQKEIFSALDAPQPVFAHHNLMTNMAGERLSKREGSISLSALRQSGLEGGVVALYALNLGEGEMRDVDRHMHDFDISTVPRARIAFDRREIERLNGIYLQEQSFSDVALRLQELGIGGGEEFWHGVRENITYLADARYWWDIIHGSITPIIAGEDRVFIAHSAACLPDLPWDGDSFSLWISTLKSHPHPRDEKKRSGKNLFHPLRLALTGCETGPKLSDIFLLLGREKVLHRLYGHYA